MQNGLERRGYKEVGFLREVDEVVRTGDAFSTTPIYPVKRKTNLPGLARTTPSADNNS
jgi:hypothetical protein